LALRDREGNRGAEIEVSKVGGAKKGIFRHHRIQGNVDGSERSYVSRGRTGGGETITSRGASNATTHIVGERARWSGAYESRRSPLLLDDSVVVGGGRGVRVYGSESTGALHQLDEFVVVAGDPLAPERAGQG
jgi:hypothetical protein